ncbi:MAG: CoA ligase [Bacteroidetes bacterium HGW-Bacteroidetes-6]|jgi:acetyltransferase|nr:MAG: CoA ligase [Bacteroidetes bacterium HGW-Bacteroidetes-6]
MITRELIQPRSIVIVGASQDVRKPGGKVLKNIIDNQFDGPVYVVNPKEVEIQGVKCHADVRDLPQTDLAILAIAARFCPETVEILAREKGTKAFIILSAGFSEESEEGKALEQQIVKTITENNACLIGPNCIGVMTPHHASVFTTPIPKLEASGVDFISGSGATAVFIMESSIPKGLAFSSVYSVGNSAQTGVEDVLEYLDLSYVEGESSKIKLLYIESVNKPQKLLKHARSLISKGCKIAAIKAGSSEAGSRAASSHTGAMASSDVAVDALFRKAGIVRCYGREELAAVASVFTIDKPKGNNIAIVTHAGGPAVMLTDALSSNGLNVPHIDHPEAVNLLEKLFPGSSVANPIDFLATGTAQQLDDILTYCTGKFDEIDAITVIFGSPGLFEVYDVYDVLHKHMQIAKKPIYPILPSIINVKNEIQYFIDKGNVFFPDEVTLGNALAKVMNTPDPMNADNIPDINKAAVRRIVDASEDGYLLPEMVGELLDAVGIPRAGEATSDKLDVLVSAAEKMGYPLVMKVVGPVHKSDVGGVVLNVKDAEKLTQEFNRMMQIKDTTAILIQPMLSGVELFAGASREDDFGHLILCGMGGIFVEVLKDVTAGLTPLGKEEALLMIEKLRGKKILEGVRGQQPVSKEYFAEILSRVSALLQVAPEITEMDINPLLGNGTKIVAVDARINLKK